RRKLQLHTIRIRERNTDQPERPLLLRRPVVTLQLQSHSARTVVSTSETANQHDGRRRCRGARNNRCRDPAAFLRQTDVSLLCSKHCGGKKKTKHCGTEHGSHLLVLGHHLIEDVFGM